MRIHQVRNATFVLEIGEHKLVVDPVLGAPGSFPGFKVVGGGRRPNPLVPLPSNADVWLDQATAVLVTHAHHVDHLDRAGVAWLKERRLPVWASGLDMAYLRAKGTDVREVAADLMGMPAEVVPAQHGHGLTGWLMGPGSGFYLAHPEEPSIYVTGDAVLTDELLAAVRRLGPDIIVAPAGAANLGFGPDILFSLDELIALAKEAPGEVVFNHLEALDHCAQTRAGLRKRLQAEGLSQRTHVPEDGESLSFSAALGERERTVEFNREPMAKPRFQKWLVGLVAKALG